MIRHVIGCIQTCHAMNTTPTGIMKYFLCVIGMVMILEGLPWFGFPDQARKALLVLAAQPENRLRNMGLCMMAGGLALVYLGNL